MSESVSPDIPDHSKDSPMPGFKVHTAASIVFDNLTFVCQERFTVTANFEFRKVRDFAVSNLAVTSTKDEIATDQIRPVSVVCSRGVWTPSPLCVAVGGEEINRALTVIQSDLSFVDKFRGSVPDTKEDTHSPEFIALDLPSKLNLETNCVTLILRYRRQRFVHFEVSSFALNTRDVRAEAHIATATGLVKGSKYS